MRKRDCGTTTYSSEGGTTATTVDFFREFPGVTIEECRKDSLGNLRRGQEQLGLSGQRQATEVSQICRDSIDGSR